MSSACVTPVNTCNAFVSHHDGTEVQAEPHQAIATVHTPKAVTQQAQGSLDEINRSACKKLCKAQGLTWAMAWLVAEAPYFSARLSTCPICALEITCTKCGMLEHNLCLSGPPHSPSLTECCAPTEAQTPAGPLYCMSARAVRKRGIRWSWIQCAQTSFPDAGLQQQQNQAQDRTIPQRELSDLQPEVHQQVWASLQDSAAPAACCRRTHGAARSADCTPCCVMALPDAGGTHCVCAGKDRVQLGSMMLQEGADVVVKQVLGPLQQAQRLRELPAQD